MKLYCNKCNKVFDVSGRIRKDGCHGVLIISIKKPILKKIPIKCPFCKTHNIRPCR